MNSKAVSRFNLMAAMALAMSEPGYSIDEAFDSTKTKEGKEEKERKLALLKGLTEFHYGDRSLFALNQKSADKKARKKCWI